VRHKKHTKVYLL